MSVMGDPAAAPAPAADRTAAGIARLVVPALAALVAAGFAVRLVVASQSLFGDELSTWWIVTTNDLGGVLSAVHSDAEISPPLSFVAGWLATQADATGEMLRLPSLLAGTLTIPVVYLVGARTVGRAAGLLAAALTTLSPFMIYYSAEGRGYALMMLFIALSTLAMLLAVDRGGVGWWVAYAAASCAAVYTHYTCVFVLGAQFAWLLWAHPEARRPALVANVAAALAFAPWVDGLLRDTRSPTTDILTALQPFEWTYIREAFEHWAIGYPYGSVGANRIPGPIGLALLGGAAVVTAAGLWRTRAAALRAPGPRRDRLLLLVALAVAIAVGGVAMAVLGGTHILSTRNLAASWPAYALVVAALATAAGPRLRYAAAALLVAGFGVSAVKMLDSDYSRPQYEHAGELIRERAEPGSVVIDETARRSPGPLSNLDPQLDGSLRTFRSLAPQQSEKPFSFADRNVPPPEAARNAARAAAGRPIFLVTHTDDERARRPMPGYRLVERREYPGINRVVVRIYERD